MGEPSTAALLPWWELTDVAVKDALGLNLSALKWLLGFFCPRWKLYFLL